MTRKFAGAMLLLISMIILAACGSTDKPFRYTDSLTGAHLEWAFGGVTYTGTVNLTGDDTGDVTYRPSTVAVESPEDVSGITVTYGKDGVSASVGQVSFTLPEHTGDELYALVRILSFTGEDVTERRGSDISFKEETPAGTLTCTLTVDDRGYPEKGTAVLDGVEIQVRFLEFFERETGTSGAF